MNNLLKCLLLFGIISLLLLLGISINKYQEKKDHQKKSIKNISFELKAIEKTKDINTKIVDLGKKLFHDKRLSANNSISCASCHQLDLGGDDNIALPIGIHGSRGTVNTLSVINAALNEELLWDGRAHSLEEQVSLPIHNPKEMGSNWKQVILNLENDKEYITLFKKSFPNKGMNAETISKSIADFQRTLLSLNSKFDQYIRGNQKVFNDQEKNGHSLFRSLGCVLCHNGMNIGGNGFQRIGKQNDFFANKIITQSDYGRFNVTGKEEDRFKFRVPSLRNVEHTAPYFHDGSAKTLTEAVQIMAWVQLGDRLSDQQANDIVAFLKTLSAPIVASHGVNHE